MDEGDTIVGLSSTVDSVLFIVDLSRKGDVEYFTISLPLCILFTQTCIVRTVRPFGAMQKAEVF